MRRIRRRRSEAEELPAQRVLVIALRRLHLVTDVVFLEVRELPLVDLGNRQNQLRPSFLLGPVATRQAGDNVSRGAGSEQGAARARPAPEKETAGDARRYPSIDPINPTNGEQHGGAPV